MCFQELLEKNWECTDTSADQPAHRHVFGKIKLTVPLCILQTTTIVSTGFDIM